MCIGFNGSDPQQCQEKIDGFLKGELDHAVELLTTLQKMADDDGNIKAISGAPLNISTPVTWVPSPCHWKFVETALIKSIRKGIFFDRKYWARYSKIGDGFKPVHFSSIIMNDKTQQLDQLVRYVRKSMDFESDCEEDSRKISEKSEGEDEMEEHPRAVFLLGSYSAWESLFFYRCTDEISFAPRRSRRVKYRLDYIHKNTVASAPPPCSSKSVYILAGLLQLDDLEKTARQDVKQKAHNGRVMTKDFPWVAAIQDRVIKTECEHLIRRLNEEEGRYLQPSGAMFEITEDLGGMPEMITWKSPFDFKKLKP